MGVYKRGKTWWIGYTDGSGQWRRESSDSHRKTDAVKMLAKLKVEVFEGKHPECKKGRKIRFDVFAEIYKKEFCPTIKSGKAYSYLVDHLKTYFGKYDLDQIRKVNVDAYRKARLQQKAKNREATVSRSTINRELAILRHALNTAVSWGYIRLNPVEKIKMYREPKKERIFSDAEIRVLISKASLPMKYFIQIAINTGMREAEIMGLRWDEIDLKREIIVLKATRTKSETLRHVNMNSTMKRLLSELSLQRKDSEFVFPNSKTGKPFKWISHAWHRLIERCEIDPPGRFHDLRHTWASKAIESGASPVAVQAILGHQDLRTTSRYSHASDEGKKRAVSLVEFSGEGGEVVELPKAAEGQK